jgi:hypothetical protein
MTATLPALADLDLPGVDLILGTVDRHECPWCGMQDAVTTVCVTGEPAPHIVTPIDGDICVCRACAPEVVGRALAEQDRRSRRPIRVEVQR